MTSERDDQRGQRGRNLVCLLIIWLWNFSVQQYTVLSCLQIMFGLLNIWLGIFSIVFSLPLWWLFSCGWCPFPLSPLRQRKQWHWGSVPGVHTWWWQKYTYWAYLVGQWPFAQFLAAYSVFSVTMHIRQVYLESHWSWTELVEGRHTI